MTTLSYPGTRKQDRDFDTSAEAVAEAYREADEYTVEVHEGDTLLVRYEQRDEPVVPKEPVGRASGVNEPGPDGS